MPATNKIYKQFQLQIYSTQQSYLQIFLKIHINNMHNKNSYSNLQQRPNFCDQHYQFNSHKYQQDQRSNNYQMKKSFESYKNYTPDRYYPISRYSHKQDKENREQMLKNFSKGSKNNLSSYEKPKQNINYSMSSEKSHDYNHERSSFGQNILKRSYLQKINQPNNAYSMIYNDNDKKSISHKKYNYQNQSPVQPYYKRNLNKRINTQADDHLQAYTTYNHRREAVDCQIINKNRNQKISNIEKINEKIKQILNTLNEEEKKLANNTNQHFKILNPKKRTLEYETRIKTEGDYEPSYHDHRKKYDEKLLLNSKDYDQHYDRELKKNYQQKKLEETNVNHGLRQKNSIYSKFQGIKNKYQNKIQENIKTIQNVQNKAETNVDNNSSTHYRKISFENLGVDNFDSFNVHNNEQERLEPQNKSKSQFSRVRCFTDMNNEPENMKHNLYQNQFKNENFTNDIFSSQNNNGKSQIIERIDQQGDDFSKLAKININTPNRKSFIHQGTNQIDRSKDKDYDKQIERIQEKIQSFENIKKQLGIYDESTSPNKNIRSMMKASKISHSRSKSTAYVKQQDLSSNQYQKKKQHRSRLSEHNSHNTGIYKVTGRFVGGQQERLQTNYETSSFSNKQLCENNYHDISVPKPFKLSSKRNTSKFSRASMINYQSQSSQKLELYSSQIQHTDFNEPTNKFKHMEASLIENSVQETKEIVKSLITNLCQQIMLDGKVRDLKKWLMKKNCTYKWYEVKKILSSQIAALKKNKISDKIIEHFEELSQKQNLLKQAFSLTEQEDNPFYTQRDQDGASYNMLVDTYFQAEYFWHQKIYKQYSKFSLHALEGQIDIDHKGYITVEDLVRFINIESDQYYRNRDISLIFKRLFNPRQNKANKSIQDNPTIKISDILEQFCHNFP